MKEESEEKLSLSLLEWESQMMDAAMMRPSERSFNAIIDYAKKVMCGVCKEEIKEGQINDRNMHISCAIQYDIISSNGKSLRLKYNENGEENIS